MCNKALSVTIYDKAYFIKSFRISNRPVSDNAWYIINNLFISFFILKIFSKHPACFFQICNRLCKSDLQFFAAYPFQRLPKTFGFCFAVYQYLF